MNSFECPHCSAQNEIEDLPFHIAEAHPDASRQFNRLVRQLLTGMQYYEVPWENTSLEELQCVESYEVDGDACMVYIPKSAEPVRLARIDYFRAKAIK